VKRNIPLAQAAPLLVVAVLLLATLPADVSPIDGGELSSVANRLGIAHPTGYPLWTIAARLVSILPIGPTVPWRLGLLSCASGLAAIALLAPILTRGGNTPTGVAVLLLAGSMPVFLDAVRSPEVYGLSLLFLALLLRLAWEAARGRVPHDRAVLTGAFLVGLGSGVHMTLVLAVPALLYLAYRARARLGLQTWVLALAFALLGRTIYAYLPIRSAAEPPFDWGNPQTWRALNAHVFAWQYRVWMLESTEALTKNLRLFGSTTWNAFSVLLLLVPIGLASLARRERTALIASVILFVAFLGYSLVYSIHDISLYFLPAHFVVLFWISMGAIALVDRLATRRRGRAARAPGDRGGWSAAAIVVALIVLVPAALSWRTNGSLARREARATESFARSLLESLPPRAILLSRNWDVVVSPILYLQNLRGLRTDVTVVDQEHFRRSWYQPLLARTIPDLAGTEAARRESAEFLRLLAPFEAGRPFDRDALQAAYERMIHAIVDADPTRPLLATADVEPTLVRPYRAEPFGLVFRMYRPGETEHAFYRGDFPSCEAVTRERSGEWERFTAQLAVDNALMNAEFAIALRETALARQRLEEVERCGLAATPQLQRLRTALAQAVSASMGDTSPGTQPVR
jgi:hypothetical protein